MLVNERENDMLYTVLLTCKKILLVIIIIFIFGECSSQRHRIRRPKSKGCDCPHFSQDLFIRYQDNYTDKKING
jgi:hypothetical protein